MSYKNILLINEETLKNYSLLSDNLDFKMVTPIIKLVQEEILTNLLGEKLFKEIREQINTDTLTESNRELLDYYITDILIWSIMSKLQIPINYKFRNIGYAQQSDSNNLSTSLDNIQYLEEWYKSNTQTYIVLMDKFIRGNKSNYPLYCPNLNYIDNYECSIYLG